MFRSLSGVSNLLGRPANFSSDYLKYFQAATLIDGSADPTDAFFTLFENNVFKKIGATDMLLFLGAKNATVNILDGSDQADIQALFDAVLAYVPYGMTTTFQFEDPTTVYALNAQLTLAGFFGSGQLNIEGNSSEGGTLHSNQAVVLDWTGNACNGFVSQFNSVVTNINNIKFIVDDGQISLFSQRSVQAVNVEGCLMDCTGTSTTSNGVFFNRSGDGYLKNNYFTAGRYAVRCGINSKVHSWNSNYITTQPHTGLRAESGGYISKRDTQPTGSTANESTAFGGNIY